MAQPRESLNPCKQLSLRQTRDLERPDVRALGLRADGQRDVQAAIGSRLVTHGNRAAFHQQTDLACTESTR